MNVDSLRLLALCAVRVDGKSLDWSMLARVASTGGLNELYEGRVPVTESSTARAKTTPMLREGLKQLSACEDRVSEELELAESVGASLVTVFDKDYPSNLRLVPDLPPFLFYRGSLRLEDRRSVAVVGTRKASADGLARARRMAHQLVEHGVTVSSGLAKGIDTAAHKSALLSGGRTIAVIGTGITRCYPPENADLAEQIVGAGAVVSQFWPSRPPGRDTFPRRNRVMSGISQGTVVIEASRTSGAKMQARLAAEHGKRVWLIHSLVESQDWARTMVDRGLATDVSSVDDVARQLADPAEVGARARHAQETLSFA